MKTYDFSLFKSIDQNRSISPKHVNTLKSSIKKTNKLEFHPIIVDSDLNILDGQHRLEAVKQLNEECGENKYFIHYVIDEYGKKYDIISYNANMKRWMLKDYLFYWKKEGKEFYVWFDKLQRKYSIGFSALYELYSLQ